VVRAWLAALLLLSAPSCFRNPVTLISEAAEREIGAETHKRLVEEYGRLDNPVLREYVAAVGRRVAAVSDRPKLAYEFTVLDAEMVNAFAVPGGYIYVTRGMLDELTSEAELAVVLGHEIGHVCAWHSINMIEKQMGYGALATLGAIVSGVQAGPEAMILVAQTAELFTGLYLLGYSREYELEADRVGLRYAISAGYNPEAGLAFFKRLAELEKREGLDKWEPFFRSHPPTGDRIVQAEKYIGRMNVGQRRFTEGFEAYQEMKERLPHLSPGERGRTEGAVFRHEGLGVELELPEGWKWDPGNRRSLAAFRQANGAGWGELRRRTLGAGMDARDFARKTALEKQWTAVGGRQVLYPAGYGFLGHYYGAGALGGAFHIRALFVVRGGDGYSLLCAAPPEKAAEYLIPFEQILRGFKLK
jgi:predicted Zn-dependent protease